MGGVAHERVQVIDRDAHMEAYGLARRRVARLGAILVRPDDHAAAHGLAEGEADRWRLLCVAHPCSCESRASEWRVTFCLDPSASRQSAMPPHSLVRSVQPFARRAR